MPFKGNTTSAALCVLLAVLLSLLLLVLVIRCLKWLFGKGVFAACEKKRKKARCKKAEKSGKGDTGYTGEWLIPEVDVSARLLCRLDLNGMDIYWLRVLEFLECKTSSFLGIRDDVREIVNLAAAGLPMPLGSRQKVIFTTRSQSICAEMGCAGNNIKMQCLGEDDAWDLFRYNVGDELIDTDPEIKVLAKQIVAKCQGFPSILCSIGHANHERYQAMEGSL